MLDVGDGHSLYWELCGNPDGKPVVFLHGGPGGGSSPDHRRQFNPDKYKILVFDQRGCGKSTPYASLENNTTWDLVDDIEKLRTAGREGRQMAGVRRQLGLDARARLCRDTIRSASPSWCCAGIFLFDQYEIDWMYKRRRRVAGLSRQVRGVPCADPGGRARRFGRGLSQAADQRRQGRAARRRQGVEQVGRRHRHPAPEPVDDRAFHLARSRCRGRADREPLHGEQRLARGRPAAARRSRKLRGIPGVIVQGRHDTCTPPVAAWKLKQAWPEVELNIIPDGGHLFSEPGVLDGLIRATDKFADVLIAGCGGRRRRG